MNNEQHRSMLVSEFNDLVIILHRKGLGNEIPTIDELKDYSNNDLSEWIRQMKEVARTPSD